jgi:ParB/RepB/Spo0J family partition protein
MEAEFETLALKELTDGTEVGFENPREKIDAKEIANLAADIAANGLYYPLLVWQTEKDGKTVKILIGGHRRKTAIELLIEEGRAPWRVGTLEKKVPVRYIAGKTLRDAKYNALADNLHRQELTSYELAQEMSRLKVMGDAGKTIAQTLHKSETWVSRKLGAFEKAGAALKRAWKAQKLSDDNVEALAKLPEEEQEEAAEKLAELRTQGRKGRSQARQTAKGRNAVQRPAPKLMTEMILLADEAEADLRYVQGVKDALRFATGAMPLGKFDPEWKTYVKEVQAAADAKAKADAAAEKAKEKEKSEKKSKKDKE